MYQTNTKPGHGGGQPALPRVVQLGRAGEREAAARCVKYACLCDYWCGCMYVEVCVCGIYTQALRLPDRIHNLPTQHIHIPPHTHTHVYIHTYIYKQSGPASTGPRSSRCSSCAASAPTGPCSACFLGFLPECIMIIDQRSGALLLVVSRSFSYKTNSHVISYPSQDDGRAHQLYPRRAPQRWVGE